MASIVSNKSLLFPFETILQKKMQVFIEKVANLNLSIEVIDQIAQLAKKILESSFNDQMMQKAAVQFLEVGRVTDSPDIKLLFFQRSKEFEELSHASAASTLNSNEKLRSYVQSNLGEKAEKVMGIILTTLLSKES